MLYYTPTIISKKFSHNFFKLNPFLHLCGFKAKFQMAQICMSTVHIMCICCFAFLLTLNLVGHITNCACRTLSKSGVHNFLQIHFGVVGETINSLFNCHSACGEIIFCIIQLNNFRASVTQGT